MSTLIIQPSTIDNWLQSALPTTNYGGDITLSVQEYSGGSPHNYGRTIIKFDFSSLPVDAIISAASLGLYSAYQEGSAGRTYWAYELTQTEWVELESTWNIYKTGSAWAAAGGDFTTTDGASVTVPAVPAWLSWNVLNLVKHFQASHGKIAHFLIKDGTEGVSGTFTSLKSREYIVNTSLCPKLVITYTVPGVGADSNFFLLM